MASNGSSELSEISYYEDAMLSARDVETGYGDLQVLYGIDFDIREDEIVLVFGPNGAGKSTFMKVLYKFLPLWNGTISLNGEDLSGVKSNEMIKLGVGYVPQRENIFPNLTVSENLDIGGIYAQDIESRKNEIFELFPRIKDRRSQRASTLSGGERQMLAMGRALIPNPDLLLIDEPSAGLAPQLIDQMLGHISQIRETGTSVVMIEQNVKLGLQIADRGYVLDNGETRFEGPSEALKESEQIGDLYLGR